MGITLVLGISYNFLSLALTLADGSKNRKVKVESKFFIYLSSGTLFVSI
jgi:hypothetical protein